MEIYEKSFLIEREGLQTAQLFRELQQVSVRHCDRIGYGMDVVGPKGLIWVVVRQRLDIERWPQAGETIGIRTWPGDTRHGMFPRYYRMEDEAGQPLGEGCALWTLVDAASRRMVRPEDYGVSLEGLKTGREGALPHAPEKLPVSRSMDFVVPEEFLDSNGHMNNTRYYELAERCIGEELSGAKLRRAVTTYSAEALLGDRLELQLGQEGKRYFISGRTDADIFKMYLEYR